MEATVKLFYEDSHMEEFDAAAYCDGLFTAL